MVYPPNVSPGNIPGYGGVYNPEENDTGTFGPGEVPGYELSQKELEDIFNSPDLQNPNRSGGIVDPLLQNFANQPAVGPPFNANSPIYPNPSEWSPPTPQGETPPTLPTMYDGRFSPGIQPIAPGGTTSIPQGTALQPEPTPWTEPTAIPGAETMPEPPPGVYGTELGANLPNLSDTINAPAGYGAPPGLQFGEPGAQVQVFNAANAPAAYPDFLQYPDYGNVGGIFGNPPDYVTAPPDTQGVAAGTAMTPYEYNLPDVGSAVFGPQLDPNIPAAAYDPGSMPGDFLTQGFPDQNVPTAPGVEPDVLPAQPLEPYPQMPNIPINPSTGLPWTAADIPGVAVGPRDIINMARQPTNYPDLSGVTDRIGNFLGGVGDFFNQPGYYDPAYLTSIGYTPGQGTGSLWPGEGFAGARGGPLAGGGAGLGSGGGGILTNSWQTGIGQMVLRNWLHSGGRIGSASVPNPQATTFFANALASNPLVRARGPITFAQNVALTPELRATITSYLRGGSGVPRGTFAGGDVYGPGGAGRPMTSAK